MTRGKAERRRQQAQAKRRARFVLRKWGIDEPTPTHVGHIADTHGKPCSCYGCGNARAWEGPTMQERRQDERRDTE